MMKLRRFLTLSILTLSSLVAHGRGGDLVNNGGGIAEKNMIYAYERLDKYIKVCLNSASCKLNDQQKVVLEQILKGMPDEKAQRQLYFGSESKEPGSFIIDGLVRVAKTGSNIGSPIYINSDLLYSKNEAGVFDPVSIPEAVAILIHEMGHHYGEYSHEELDLIGVRASLTLQQKFISTPMIPWTSEISASVFNPNLVTSFPEVLLTVGNDVIDISEMYRDVVLCAGITIPIPILPIPDIEILNKKPVASILHNMHWAKLREKDDQLYVTITGAVSNSCVSRSNVGIRNNESKLNINFRIRKEEGVWKISRSSIQVEQFKDPWWKIIRLPNLLPSTW